MTLALLFFIVCLIVFLVVVGHVLDQIGVFDKLGDDINRDNL